MSTVALVSLDEYLNSSYEADMEFVGGVLVERNVGTMSHSLLLTQVILHFGQLPDSYRLQVLPSVRLRIDDNHVRVPDVLVLEEPYQVSKVVTDVPVITVEIKSPDDKFDDIVDKCFEYEALGVRNILVMDPDHRRTWLFEQSSLRLLTGTSQSLQLSHGTLDFPFSEMFAELYED